MLKGTKKKNFYLSLQNRIISAASVRQSIVFFLLFFGFLSIIRADDISAGVEIIEINYDDDISDTGNEWIECVNKTGGTIDISGWKFDDSTTTVSMTVSQVTGWGDITAIPDGSVFVVCEDSAVFTTRFGPAVASKYLAKISNVDWALSASGDPIGITSGGIWMQRFVYPDNATNKSIIKSTFTDNEELSASWVAGLAGGNPFVEDYGGVGGGGATGSANAGDMLVSEVCVEGSTGFLNNDWVEIYAVSSGNYSGCLLYEADSVVKTFPAGFNAGAGDYIVIHEETGTDETDATGKGANGYWDFYGCGDYTATDNIISVRSPSGNWVDAMGFSNQDGDMTSTNGTAYNNMVSTNMWTGGPATFTDTVNDAAVQASLADYSAGGANKSLVRLSTSTDTNSKNDWFLTTTLTPGTSSAVIIPILETGAITGKITEVAPNISGGGDFIEIFVTAASPDVSGVKLYEGTTLIKIFPSDMGAIAKDKFIILWASKANNPTGTRGVDRDETVVDENGNGYIDLFSDETSATLTGTDNNITLKNANDTIVDFMSFINDTVSSAYPKSAYDNAFTAGQWYPEATDDATYISGSFAWSYSSSKSMYRLSAAGAPTDTNTKADWSESSTTPGYGDYGGTVINTTKTLEVFQSPFSPYKDGTYSQAKIAYNVPANSQITMRVFDVSGHQVRILLDHSDGGGASATVSWDGKDDDGNIVKTGVYIVNIEALDKTTGSARRSSKRVVVGRKM